MRHSGRHATIVGLLVVVLAACGGGSSGKSSAPSGGTTPKNLPQCPLASLQSAKKPVEITYWHAMTAANEEELKRLTAQFNAQQQDVHVTLSAAPSYFDNLTRFKAGLGTGVLPDLFQGEEIATQQLIDTKAVLPAQSCLDADHASTADIVPRVKAYFSDQGVLQAMPFNDSNPVLYYNTVAFTKAGLDPNNPPKTLEELKAASEKIVSSGAAKYGLAMKIDGWFIEHWRAKANQLYVDNDNGRSGRATKVVFDDPTTVQLFTWWNDMVKSKLAVNTGTSDVDHYLAVGNGDAAMTIDTSAALGTIFQRLSQGEYQGVHVGTAPLPGPSDPQGGVLVGGGANFIVNKSAPEKQAAAYEFAKFLLSPQTQSSWAAATGYVPVSQAATTLDPLKTKWAQQPAFKVAYDQLRAGGENAATAGPLIGAYGGKGEGVRGAVMDAIQSMLSQNVPPAQAVHAAAQNADTAIDEYNSRVG